MTVTKILKGKLIDKKRPNKKEFKKFLNSRMTV